MNKKIFKISIAILIALVIARLCIGNTIYSPLDVILSFVNQGEASPFIIFNLRMPAVIAAILIAICLTFAGTLLKVITKNDLADPGILGVSSGAVFCIVISSILLSKIGIFELLSAPVFGFIGALITAMMIIRLSTKNGEINGSKMLLIGVGFNLLFGTMTTYIKSFLPGEIYNNLTTLIQGNLDNVSIQTIMMLGPIVLVVAIFVIKSSYNLSALSLTRPAAIGIGFDFSKWKLVYMIIAVIFTAISIMFGGAISFLGILGPQLASRFIRGNYKQQLYLGTIISSIIVISADIISRNLFGFIVPLDTMISLIGAPVFMYLLLFRRK